MVIREITNNQECPKESVKVSKGKSALYDYHQELNEGKGFSCYTYKAGTREEQTSTKHSIIFVHSGLFYITHNDVKVQLCQDEMFLFPAGSVYYKYCPVNSNMALWEFDANVLEAKDSPQYQW